MSLLFGRVVKVVLKLPKVQWTPPFFKKIGAVVKAAIEGAVYASAGVIKPLGRRRRTHVVMCA